MSAVVVESDAWRNFKNFSYLKENQTPSLRYPNQLSDPTSWLQWACSFCYDKNIDHVLNVLNNSSYIVSAQLSANKSLEPERVRSIIGTISKLDNLANKFKTKELTEVQEERRVVEKKLNMGFAKSCNEMVSRLRKSSSHNPSVNLDESVEASFDKKKVN